MIGYGSRAGRGLLSPKITSVCHTQTRRLSPVEGIQPQKAFLIPAFTNVTPGASPRALFCLAGGRPASVGTHSRSGEYLLTKATGEFSALAGTLVTCSLHEKPLEGLRRMK